MQVPVVVYCDVERTRSSCMKCSEKGLPLYNLLIESGEGEGAIGPICVNCLLNRVLHGIVSPTKVKVARPPTAHMKKLSRKQEEKVMTGVGGRRQPGSGAVPGYKGDGRLKGHIRMEAKFTYAKSFSVKRSELDKIRGECEDGEKPAFVIDFKDKGSGKTKDRWVIITHKDWENMINALAPNS